MKRSTLLLLISTAFFFTSTLVLLYLNFNKSSPVTTPTPIPTPSVIPTATIDPTASWKEYINKQVGFSFKYPSTVLINSSNKNLDDTSLFIKVTKMSEIIDEPLGFTKETAYQDMASLSLGNYGNKVGFPINESEKVFEIGNINGKTFSSFANMEICGVVFGRIAIVYHDDYQIIISYIGPQSFSKQLGTYMTTDSNNCGSSLIWKNSQGFYQDLLNGRAPKEIQEWYSNFDQILSTFKFTFPDYLLEDGSTYQKINNPLSWDNCGADDNDVSRNIKQKISALAEVSEKEINGLKIISTYTLGFTQADVNQFYLCQAGAFSPLKVFPNKILWISSCSTGAYQDGVEKCEDTRIAIQKLYKL